MLKKILSISGKSGLFKLVSRGKNMIIVESLIDGKRIPAHSTDKIIALSDIAIYTDDQEVPLHTVLESLRVVKGGAESEVTTKSDNKEITKLFAEILPTYDRDRVHIGDMKKLLTWYNILIKAGFDSFAPQADSQEPETATTETTK